jgi:hypothetical protein
MSPGFLNRVSPISSAGAAGQFGAFRTSLKHRQTDSTIGGGSASVGNLRVMDPADAERPPVKHEWKSELGETLTTCGADSSLNWQSTQDGENGANMRRDVNAWKALRLRLRRAAHSGLDADSIRGKRRQISERVIMKTLSSPSFRPDAKHNHVRRVSGWLVAALVAWVPVAGFELSAAEPADTAGGTKEEGRWRELFDGKTLKGWKVVDFAGGGEVKVEDGTIRLGSGIMLTGVTHTNPLPKVDYEVELEAKKLEGYDFFCGLTFPVSDSFCTLIVGGWGGGLVGLSSIDNYDASENETTQFMRFERDQWYSIRVRVSETKIEAWIDQDKLVDLTIVGRKVGLRSGEIESLVPLGVGTWQTSAALRNVRIRSVARDGG